MGRGQDMQQTPIGGIKGPILSAASTEMTAPGPPPYGAIHGHLDAADGLVGPETCDEIADAILATVRNTDHRLQMVAKVKAVVNNCLRSRMARLHDLIKDELGKQR